MAAGLKDGDVLLLENLVPCRRRKNDPEFSRQLASLADVGIDDAFGCCHRAMLRLRALRILAAGCRFLTGKEIRFLGDAVETRLILCGHHWRAKVSDKIEVISNLLRKLMS